jgi:hypothetical protein
MKKYFIIPFLLAGSISSHADVAFSPYPFTVFCYSAELIYNYEMVKNARNSTSLWGGAGFVGSFLYPDVPPAFGFEIAVEKRHYFKPEDFRHFFISAYLGSAFMMDNEKVKYFGVIPGLKINYKAQLSKILILEPYLSLSLPIYTNLNRIDTYPPLPVLTIGARLAFSKLKIK